MCGIVAVVRHHGVRIAPDLTQLRDALAGAHAQLLEVRESREPSEAATALAPIAVRQ